MNHVVAVPLDPELAQLVGKKGSENSITFYNSTIDGHVIVALAPTSMEDKFYAAAETLLLAQQVLLSTRDVDSLFGEMVVACSLMDNEVLLTDDSDVSGIVGKAGIGKLTVVGRGDVLERIKGFSAGSGEPDVDARIDIDKAFDVKGIGTVALGLVTRGSVKVHDELFHSSGRKAVVRSIQSQDRDIAEAGTGTRVGLALKGIDTDSIRKGDLLTAKEVKPVAAVDCSIRLSGVAKEDLQTGKVYGFISNFSYTNASVVRTDGNSISLKLEKAIQVEKGDSFMLMRTKLPRLFASGHVVQTGHE